MLLVPQIVVIVLSALAMASYLWRWRRHHNGVILSRAMAWGVVVLLYLGITLYQLDHTEQRSVLVLTTWIVLATITTVDNYIVYRFEKR